MATDPRKIKGKYHLFFSEVATSENSQLLKTRVTSLILLAPMGVFPFCFHVVLYCPLNIYHMVFRVTANLKTAQITAKKLKKSERTLCADEIFSYWCTDSTFFPLTSVSPKHV